ncbi:ribosome silencing factor [Acidobacteria bacterium AH-259-D05]|nr:ribosome silencing factor [Acidobacteria bacterium AH-259-D05]
MKQTKTVLKKVCKAIEGKKGDDVTILDVSRTSSFTDFFVICHGLNDKQNQAICDEIMEKLKKEEHRFPNHIEGYQHAEWILMDYLDIVVHIFSSRTRESYNLEKLWSDGIEVKPKVLTA